MRNKIIIVLILLIILVVALGLSLFYGLNIPIKILLICMLSDYLIGVSMAVSGNSKHGKISSQVGYTGIVKKSIMLFIVVIMGLLEQILKIDFLQKTITIAFIFNELLSIFESAEKMGIPINTIILNFINRKGEKK